MDLSIPKDASDVSEDVPLEEDTSLASSTSSARPGAVYVGGSESNHDELPLQTQEEPDMEHGFETSIIPIAAEFVRPDNKEIEEAQIVETADTATLCGQPRWLIFALLGVLVTIAIGAGLGVVLSNGGDVVDRLAPSDAPTPSDRRNKVEEIISAQIPSFQLGPSQIKALNWLANEDPAMLDFETTPFGTILERYAIVTLYYSLNGPLWMLQLRLSEESVCSWGGNTCDPMVTQIILFNNNLRGQLPTELGLLTGLQSIYFGKFATISSSEFDTIIWS
jgi:hypothetical protein